MAASVGWQRALAATRARWEVRLFERAVQFSEVGAGVHWAQRRALPAGLGPGARAERSGAFPQHLQVRSAMHGVLATLALGDATVPLRRAPYATIHRADLHSLLLHAVQDHPPRQPTLGHAITQHRTPATPCWCHVVHGHGPGKPVEGDALMAPTACGAHRTQPGRTARPAPPGTWPYRALVPAQALPAAWRAQVTAWLGPRLHACTHPRAPGRGMNLVVIIHGNPPRTWSTGTTPPTPPTWPMP